jgi:competence protein ComEA
MEPDAPPPWRVFDAPAPATDDQFGRHPMPVAVPSDGTLDQTLRRIGGRRAAAVAAGLGASVGGLVLAVLLASGGMGGDVTLGAVGAHPFGSTGAPRSSGLGPDVGSGPIVVDVAGAVLRPGVYRLAAGARIGDAIAAAGGYSPRVAAEVVSRTLNLAALVHDGDLIVIPSRDDPVAAGSPPGGGSGTGSGGGAAGPLDLNAATAEALDGLPGVGPVTAAKIIASRAQTPFRSVDDLLSRKLVGQKVFDQIRSLVAVR